MEAVTAFLEGPGCFLIVWGMLARKAWRYSAITLVSLGQLYGDVLYFATCLHGGGCDPAARHRRCSGCTGPRGVLTALCTPACPLPRK